MLRRSSTPGYSRFSPWGEPRRLGDGRGFLDTVSRPPTSTPARRALPHRLPRCALVRACTRCERTAPNHGGGAAVLVVSAWRRAGRWTAEVVARPHAGGDAGCERVLASVAGARAVTGWRRGAAFGKAGRAVAHEGYRELGGARALLGRRPVLVDARRRVQGVTVRPSRTAQVRSGRRNELGRDVAIGPPLLLGRRASSAQCRLDTALGPRQAASGRERAVRCMGRFRGCPGAALAAGTSRWPVSAGFAMGARA